MDPNEALKLLRKYASDTGGEAWEQFEALDDWLSKGGFLPKAWTTVSRPTAPAYWHVEALARMLWTNAIRQTGVTKAWDELPIDVRDYWRGRAEEVQQ